MRSVIDKHKTIPRYKIISLTLFQLEKKKKKKKKKWQINFILSLFSSLFDIRKNEPSLTKYHGM